ncbi:MAG: hypothetical protein K9L74_05665 [Candidatus Izimaplasma sp.]|nr:hypothetical protein [Candidatus Izimaplasma bacterium]
MRFDNLKLYTQRANRLTFTSDKNYMLMYFSENSDLASDYPSLKLRKQDVKYIIVPQTRIPRTYLDNDIKKVYKAYGLLTLSSNQKAPDNSFIFDLSQYLNKIDESYNPQHYRQRSGFLISNMVMKSFNKYDLSYDKILMYTINKNESFRRFIDMKIFPVIQKLKNEEVDFDHFILGVIDNESVSYRLLMKDGEFNLKRIITILRSIKPALSEDEIEEEFDEQSNKIVNKINKKLDLASDSKNKLKDALYTLLQTDEELYEKITDEDLSTKDLKSTIIKSVLYKVSGNIDRATNITNSIPENKLDVALKRLKDSYIDQIIPSDKLTSMSDDIMLQMYDIIGAVDGKNPSHLFNKRHIDFETNLKNDLTNGFKILENKEIPLKLKSFNIVDKPSRNGELHKTDISIAKAELEDQNGNLHKIKIQLPKIDPNSGTFLINGRKHCLLNQIILCPISFPKLYMSKFQSSYSSFHIWSKRTKHLKYLEIYMGSYKLPLFPVLAFSFGFEKTMEKYDLKYNIVNEKPDKTKTFIKINDEKYIVLNNINNDLKEEVFKSLELSKLHEIESDSEFPSKEFFSDAIYQITGRTNATYLIQNNLDNIVDPIAKQVLINMSLPYKLENIMYYMASKVVEGYVQDRNDVSNQRVRGSEIIAELAQKQILASYTEYREQVLSGNENAEVNLQEDKVLRDFRNSEIVVDMEYANPIEEMVTMTRITPIGKSIGGIPDKRALMGKALNVHDSYFGNIDPLDTPEGETIGITQQLTIDAALSSARGMFSTKEINDDENSGILSTSASLIPFVENNDGARIIMATNQSRQMLPLMNPQPSLIQSGYESILTNLLSDAYVKKSPCAGKVTKIDETNIEITCKNGKKHNIDISPVPLKSGTGKNTLSIFKSKVSLNQNLKEGQIVAEGSGLNQGTISLGRTLLCAVMPYKGHNFEDGIIISEKLVKNNLLTSVHGLEEQIEINENDKILNIITIGEETKKGDILIRKTIGDMDELLGYKDMDDDNEDFVVLGRDLVRKSPGGKVVDIEVFSNIKDSETKFPNLSKHISKTDKKYNKPEGEKYTIRGQSIQGILITFKIEQQLPIKVGDKLANRFGNKGIISLIEKEENMPRTNDGEPVEIIINPLGIIGRMNLGQLFELYTGLISKELGKRAVKLNNKDKFVKLLKKVLPLLDNTKQKTISTTFINKVNSLNEKKFKQLLDQIKKDGGVPIIIPPFKAPKHSQIYNAMRELNLKSGYKLKLPEYNLDTTNDVPIGYMYISKLEHMGSDKLHSRSTGPVTGKVMQPTAGKRRQGGQRVGEGDTYSLASYNAIYTLQEFFGPLSDDPVTKNEMISDIVENGSAEYREPKTNMSKDLVNAYFTAMMLGR